MFRTLALLFSAAWLAPAATPLAQATTQKVPKQAPTPPSPTSQVSVELTELKFTPTSVDFGAVPAGLDETRNVTLKNAGFLPIELNQVRFILGASGNSAAFKLTLAGNTYHGATGTATHAIDPPILLTRGQELQATVEFEPTEEQLDSFFMTFRSSTPVHQFYLPVTGLGGHAGDPFLHVVIDGPRWVVDYDQDGSAELFLDGTGSHTHEPGHTLSAYEWKIGETVVSTSTTLAFELAADETEIRLTISDDNVPPRSLSGEVDVLKVPPDEVPGVLALYNDASASGAAALLDDPPQSADFLEQRPDLNVGGTGAVGGSPFAANVLVRLIGKLEVVQPGTYTFTATGGAARRLYLDGTLVTGSLVLAAGLHPIEARFAVDALVDLPLAVLSQFGGGASAPVSADALTHDETGVVPVIHELTETGAIAGGDPITIDGFGFFPPQQVVVHWGDMDLIAEDFTSLTPTRIQFLSPSGGGAIAVSVENQNGASNVRTFTYQLIGPPPIQWRRDLFIDVPMPTAGVWGPDGKLYVVSLDGRVTVLEFDANYELVSQTIHAGVSLLPNHDTLSVTINPYDPPSPVKLYVGHGDLFVNGGGSPQTLSPYTGQISVLTGPSFSSPTPLITGLPTSNHDHGINGIVFDNNGDLLISVGSNTNAGVRGINHGDLPESPLSAAVLKAHLSKPGFNGTISYVETDSGLPNNDQRYGEIVDVVPGVDVEVHTAGTRNSYGVALLTTGRLYATDNGPNQGFGAASTGQFTEDPDPFDGDELNLIEWGNYHGSPNRNRGRTDPRQNVYYASLNGPPSIPDTFMQMLGWLPPSTNGIDEYRSDTFNGLARGQLIAQEYQDNMRRLRLRADGRALLAQNIIEPDSQGLSCVTGPGGAILSLDYLDSEVEVYEADDLTPTQFVVHDIFPWRAPAAGGTPFVIAGRGFGTLFTTAVTIGGLPATLTDVSWSRIHGIIPADASPTTALRDVVVTVGEDSDTLPLAFRYLLGPGNEPGRWEQLANVPSPVGEVAAAVVSGVMYLVGQGAVGATFAYDVQNRQWLSNRAARPYNGNHHAAEVVAGKVYLIGGLGGGSEGRVQIYDPASNSWTTGADMPWAAGSVSTAVIGGKIYAASGIVSTFTVSNCAVYDPELDTWTSRAAMPDGGRNHAAAGTDGTKLYVFGGRIGGNFTANGFDSLMIYDPVSNTWTWSGAEGSTLAPLPEARGGVGKAVYMRGEFYVFGGETEDDPDANANGVYDRVDVYRPNTNTWRTEAPMPNPRHGIYPVLYQGHVFIAGGGTQAGFSNSSLFDTFTRQ